jgi:hypothetical protein
MVIYKNIPRMCAEYFYVSLQSHGINFLVVAVYEEKRIAENLHTGHVHVLVLVIK